MTTRAELYKQAKECLELVNSTITVPEHIKCREALHSLAGAVVANAKLEAGADDGSGWYFAFAFHDLLKGLGVDLDAIIKPVANLSDARKMKILCDKRIQQEERDHA